MRIPEKAKKINTEKVNSYRITKGLEEDTVSSRHFVYDIDGITISLTAVNALKRPDLKSLKEFLDNLGGQSSFYHSELRTYNNEEFLVINFKEKERSKYSIYGAYKSGKQFLAAKIEYPSVMQERAKIILDKLLERAKFKRD